MKTRISWRWVLFSFLIALTGLSIVFFVTSTTANARGSLAAYDSPLSGMRREKALIQADEGENGNTTLSSAVPSGQLAADASGLSTTDTASLGLADTFIEVFTNTWSYSTIGLVYNPGEGVVRYAHESQSSTHNPTVYDVDTLSHSVIVSFALSTVNSGWPWQIDNRTGAGYDFVSNTYFLPDYNGDLSYADDNIVEIRPDGTILNVWEVDDEVGSNDSSDGTEVDNIIDIAVVPGSPPRYFVTAAYDDDVVYEVALVKTGTWWTPNSWHTVMTYTLPGFGDNLGIDYDAEHEVLFHSSWDTTTILITDLNLNPVTGISPTFDCPGAGGYNSGVTYIEGSEPPEIWVTDFSSDQTTRCLTPFVPETIPPEWTKVIGGQPWDPSVELVVETGDLIEVTDIVTAVQPFTLTETWHPDHLELVNVNVIPPLGQVMTATDSLEVVVPGGPPEVVMIEKIFHVKTCTWTASVLTETLTVEEGPVFEPRTVTIIKEPPELQIGSTYEQEVNAGSIVSFTLTYSNTGGYENNVWISNTFPINALFLFAEPFPDSHAPDGTWARWDVGDMAKNDMDSIDVYVLISETVVPSTTILIWDGIFDHVDVLRGETLIEFHANESPFPLIWEKVIDGMPWEPGLTLTRETSQTIVVQETILVPPDTPFNLLEEWNPDELTLLPGWNVVIDPPPLSSQILDDQGIWNLTGMSGLLETQVLITKIFLVKPCLWTETVLWETLVGPSGEARTRPTLIHKVPSELWIDSFFDVSVYSGDEAHFLLEYGNNGGLESNAWITSSFPAEVTFLDSTPPESFVSPDRHLAVWNLGPLASGEVGTITVSVGITNGLPPSTTIGIWGGVFNHAGELAEETGIFYHVPPPIWEKWVNGLPWKLDSVINLQTGETFIVTDVVSTRSTAALVEHWNAEHLTLMDYAIEPPAGIILSDAGFLSWRFPEGVPETITLTKLFAVQPCTWTYTVLWEELWVEYIEWERRPVHVDKVPSDLWLTSEYKSIVLAGQPATFLLRYGNTGGFESRAWISNTFPVTAPFVHSIPAPDGVDTAGRWAWWDLGALADGDEGAIEVAVEIPGTLPAESPVIIHDVIYDHVDAERDRTVITLMAGPRIYVPLVIRH